MKILITGACGFVGKIVAEGLLESFSPGELQIVGLDNFSRPGSWVNRDALRKRGVDLRHGDIRLASDVAGVGAVDWVIDAAANPSVGAGLDGKSSSRQLVEHNLAGTLNLLEHCREHGAGFILMSTSRVYSIPALAGLSLQIKDGAFRLEDGVELPEGVSSRGISERYSTAPPVSLYGSTKVASEHLALEFGATFDFPVWINRCGVLAGAGQFGRPDQGIFSFWLHSWFGKRPLCYIGYDGHGHQVRDCLHPRDLLSLLVRQVREPGHSDGHSRVVNLSGGSASARSLQQLSDWCRDRWGPREVGMEPTARPFDLPWVVLDHRLATDVWNWTPRTDVEAILTEIAKHAEAHPDWLELSQR